MSCSFVIEPASACAGSSVTMTLEGWCDPECESINFETIKSHPYLTVSPPGGSSCANQSFEREFTVQVSPDAPSGVHSFELVGMMTNGIICSAIGEVAVSQITSLVWETYGSNEPLDGCPNNLGKRMFPGKLTPTDNSAALRRQVYLTASVNPPNESCTVYFKRWDVDDPFDQNNPTMPNVSVIDNDTSGPDNRGADGGLSAGSATTDAEGKAKVYLTVSMQPGDNFRAGASLKQSTLNQATQARADANDPPEGVVFSDMLTVWRKLWIERDTMAAPDPLDFRVVSQVSTIYPTPGRPGTSTVEIACPQAGNPDTNNYEGGEIMFVNCPSGSDKFGILENYPCNDFVPYRIIIVGTPGACAAVGTGCIFYDDDDMTVLGVPSSPRFPDGGPLLQSAFQPAYILPQYADEFQSVVPFEVYLDYWEILTAEGSWNNLHTLTSSLDFWSAFILGAWEGGDDRFEVVTNGDGDPDGCPLIPGPIAPGQEVPLTGVRRPGSTEAIVFLQALADEATCLNQTDEAHTFVHEVAHTCGDLPHKVGTIMEEGAPKTQDAFDAEQLRVLREQNPW